MEKQRPQSILLPAISTETGLDDDFFWEAHWKKFVAGLIAVVLAILGWGGWSLYRANVGAKSAELYAQADSAEDWSRIAAEFPGSIPAGNAKLRIASALRSEGKFDEALAELERFTSAQPDHPLAGTAWLAVGEIRQLQGNNTAALDAYRVASGRYQQSYTAPLALLAEARILAAEGKTGESRAILESIGSSYPEGPAAMVAAAELAAISPQPPATGQAP